jgi:hypothetical protein
MLASDAGSCHLRRGPRARTLRLRRTGAPRGGACARCRGS